MAALVLAEHDGQVLQPATLNAVTAALRLGGPVDVLVAGHDVRAVAEACAAVAGVEKVLVADDPLYAHLLAETLAPLLQDSPQDYERSSRPPRRSARTCCRASAAMLDVQQISEITAVVAAGHVRAPDLRRQCAGDRAIEGCDESHHRARHRFRARRRIRRHGGHSRSPRRRRRRMRDSFARSSPCRSVRN